MDKILCYLGFHDDKILKISKDFFSDWKVGWYKGECKCRRCDKEYKKKFYNKGWEGTGHV